MEQFLQQVVSGIASGSVFAILALSIVMIYRSTTILNFAQGEMALFGTFIAWTFLGSPQEPRLPLPLALGLTLLAVVAFGLVVERVLFRRMIGRPLFATFILSLGLLAVLHGAVMLAWGPSTRVLAAVQPRGV